MQTKLVVNRVFIVRNDPAAAKAILHPGMVISALFSSLSALQPLQSPHASTIYGLMLAGGLPATQNGPSGTPAWNGLNIIGPAGLVPANYGTARHLIRYEMSRAAVLGHDLIPSGVAKGMGIASSSGSLALGLSTAGVTSGFPSGLLRPLSASAVGNTGLTTAPGFEVNSGLIPRGIETQITEMLNLPSGQAIGGLLQQASVLAQDTFDSAPFIAYAAGQDYVYELLVQSEYTIAVDDAIIDNASQNGQKLYAVVPSISPVGIVDYTLSGTDVNVTGVGAQSGLMIVPPAYLALSLTETPAVPFLNASSGNLSNMITDGGLSAYNGDLIEDVTIRYTANGSAFVTV